MTQRLWQAIALTLAVVLVGLGGVAFTVFVQRTANQPRVTATPRPSASRPSLPSGSGLASSPSPGASAVGSASPSRRPSPPSGSAQATGGSSPSGEPSPSSSAAPTPRALVGDLRFTFEKVGLDDADAADARRRAFSFYTDAPGDVRAEMVGTFGSSARLCLYQGRPDRTPAAPLCFNGRSGFVRRRSTGGRQQWTVLVSGQPGGSAATTDVTVQYRGREARVIASDFRLEGAQDPTRNGLTMRFTPRTNGPLLVTAGVEVEDDATVEQHLLVRDLGSGSDVIDESGDGTSLDTSGPVEGGSEHRLQLSGSQGTAGEGALVTATIVWP